MRRFAQAVCVLAIAIGSGLFSFGRYLEPQIDLKNPVEVAHLLSDYRAADQHFTASVCSGVGIGFLTLGTLGLVVPWINALMRKASGPQPSLSEPPSLS